MRTEIVVLTPQMAAEWLEKFNTRNRAISPTRVERYTADILAGRFKMNGQPIIFGKSGNLLDGQHRLKAIIAANKSLLVFVVRDVDDDTFNTLDSGKPREAGDVLSIGGFKDPRTLSAAAKWLSRIENGRTGSTFAGTNQDVEAIVRDNPELKDYVQKARDTYRKGMTAPPALTAALWYLFAKANDKLADWFMDRLASGDGITASDPVFTLRETILRNRILFAVKGSQSNVGLAAVIVKGWNATLLQRPVKVLRFQKDETFPSIAA